MAGPNENRTGGKVKIQPPQHFDEKCLNRQNCKGCNKQECKHKCKPENSQKE